MHALPLRQPASPARAGIAHARMLHRCCAKRALSAPSVRDERVFSQHGLHANRAQGGHLEGAALLLESGADPDVQSYPEDEYHTLWAHVAGQWCCQTCGICLLWHAMWAIHRGHKSQNARKAISTRALRMRAPTVMRFESLCV